MNLIDLMALSILILIFLPYIPEQSMEYNLMQVYYSSGAPNLGGVV